VSGFGNPRRPSAFSAELEEGRPEVAAAIACTRDAVSDAAGAPREAREARAHLTIARPRRAVSGEDRRNGLAWAEALDLRGIAIRLDRVALYTWSEDRTARLFRRVDELILPVRS
jgi:2'-5' RNA ligase